jgi:hypothetical protein
VSWKAAFPTEARAIQSSFDGTSLLQGELQYCVALSTAVTDRLENIEAICRFRANKGGTGWVFMQQQMGVALLDKVTFRRTRKSKP